MKTVVVSLDLEPDYPPYLGESCLGVDEAIPPLLDLLQSEGVPATVFMLADLCNSHPSLAKDVVMKGFHLGNHGLHHRFLCLENMPTQWRDVRESTRILQEYSGRKIVTFRAPNFSLSGYTLSCLERLNYRIDSSVLPGRRLRRWLFGYVYDFRSAPRVPYHPSVGDVRSHGFSTVLEIPASENPLLHQAPIGGGYLNTHGIAKTLEAMRMVETSAVVLVVHPWEFVNLSDRYPRLPQWMRKACRASISTLGQLIGELKNEKHKFTTLERIAETHEKISSSDIPAA